MSTQTEVYEMGGDDSIHVLTHDQLSVDLEVTVAFHLNDAEAIQVYTAYNSDYADRIIHPIVRTAVRDAASQMTALQLVDEREVLQVHMEQGVHDQIVSTLVSRGLPADSFVVENVLLRNIDLPQSLDEAIAAVQQQQQATARQQQALATAAAEAQVARTTAEGWAAANLIRAQGAADANRILSESLTPTVLRARQIDLTGQLLHDGGTRTVIVPESSMPLFQLPAQ
jgi:regulator of protease activity HflC (stomatin/prohibitin superfamily)